MEQDTRFDPKADETTSGSPTSREPRFEQEGDYGVAANHSAPSDIIERDGRTFTVERLTPHQKVTKRERENRRQKRQDDREERLPHRLTQFSWFVAWLTGQEERLWKRGSGTATWEELTRPFPSRRLDHYEQKRYDALACIVAEVRRFNDRPTLAEVVEWWGGPGTALRGVQRVHDLEAKGHELGVPKRPTTAERKALEREEKRKLREWVRKQDSWRDALGDSVRLKSWHLKNGPIDPGRYVPQVLDARRAEALRKARRAEALRKTKAET